MSTVDKTEYHLKLEEINRLVDAQDYEGALTVADSIDWRRVKSVRTLCMVADIYEVNGELEKSMQMLQLAHKRSSIGKMILYRQVELALKMGLYDDAVKYYNEYLETASNDTSKYILKYKIYKAQKAPLENQIAILEEYKEREYTERWVYELAKLYKKAGQEKKCVETCDDPDPDGPRRTQNSPCSTARSIPFNTSTLLSPFPKDFLICCNVRNINFLRFSSPFSDCFRLQLSPSEKYRSRIHIFVIRFNCFHAAAAVCN